MKPALMIGSTVVDIIVQIPRLPKTKEDIHIIQQEMTLGGCAWNAASILSLFQIPFSLCSPIGNGFYGDFVAHELEMRGISSILPRVEEANGCCYCFVEEDGERTFLCEHGAEYKFQPKWFSSLDPAKYACVYICGLEIEEDGGEAIVSFLEKHSEVYTKVCFPVIFFAPGPRILQIPNSRMERILALSCILHLNEQEALAYTQCNTVEAAAKHLYEKTRNTVIITLGEKGTYLYQEHQGFLLPSIPVEVIDTIGAGDAHIGTVIAGYMQGKSIQDAIHLANHIAAGVVASKGASLQKDTFLSILNNLIKDNA